jgi:hypothetical protein
MLLPAPDRALRRLVVELASATRGDIDAVLDELAPEQRERVQALMRDYGALAEAPSASAKARDVAALARDAGLSPWLADRLGGRAPGLTMTPASVDALRACVIDACSDGADRTTETSSTTTGLLQRFRRTVWGRRQG